MTLGRPDPLCASGRREVSSQAPNSPGVISTGSHLPGAFPPAGSGSTSAEFGRFEPGFIIKSKKKKKEKKKNPYGTILPYTH